MGKAWVKARRHDRFYRAAKKQAYRSRAAIKLSQIDRRIGLFREGDMVVDLGASPGGWSQVARERVGASGRVLAVDLAPFVPLEGVEFLRGDFQDPKVQAQLFERLRRPADVIISDMSPKLSGHRAVDVARALDLAEGALSLPSHCWKYTQPTLYDRLNQGSIPWKIYHHGFPQSLLLVNQPPI